jgi:hypothetical protein
MWQQIALVTTHLKQVAHGFNWKKHCMVPSWNDNFIKI